MEKLSFLINNFIFTTGPKHLVVGDDGVVGEYLDFETAKQKLLDINSDSRIIATSDSMGNLDTDSKKIANVLKEMNIEAVEEEKLYKLLNFGEEHLQSFRGMFIIFDIKILIAMIIMFTFIKIKLFHFYRPSRFRYCSEFHYPTKR